MPPAGARVVETAPAKVNLTLHVTGRRADGYHDLDSLVVFADVGDRIAVAPGGGWSLTVGGPFSDGIPTDDRNIVLRAARLIGGPPASIALEKHLPAAAGIGGGSADAAATLRALHRMDGRPLPACPSALGADVPVCLAGRPVRMSGIGDVLSGVPSLPPLHLCLVNPGVAVPTPAVFAALRIRDGAPMPALPACGDAAALARWLAGQRNDLEAPALTLAPVIGTVLSGLAATKGCLLARMSGSGATCFGLYATPDLAVAAGRAMARPGWWSVAAAVLGPQPEPPQRIRATT